MRRETDFVLEKAAWPTMLLEAGGTICRANQAARRVFGLTNERATPPLTDLWDEANPGSAANFLQQEVGSETVELNLRLQGGQKSKFLARVAKVSRDGQDYFVLQLFNGSGSAGADLTPVPVEKAAAIAAEKPAEDFLLHNAEWPALLVSKTGSVQRANRAAVRAFGPGIESDGARLEAFWSPLNRDSCQHFLNLPPSDQPVALKFLSKSGMPVDFAAQLCGTSSEDALLLQLLKPLPGVAAPGPAPAATPATAEGAAKADAESSLAHKQKLDCALQLARSVALDFNNALTSILGHASLLLSKGEANHPWRGSLVEIEKSAARAAEIANDLAAFSRQEKDVKQQSAGNMNQLLERTVDIFQAALQKPITFSRHLERKLFTANFDEAKMGQAMVKIFENAVDAIKADGKITVETKNLELTDATQDRTARLQPGNYVCVEISDTGSGITDEVMPHIFEPFYTTKGSKHRGLGLAWVYGIVTNHGGGVAVSSQVGTGTNVRLYLPGNTRIVREAPINDGDLNGSETILIVDDEDLLLTMCRTVLSAYGYTVLTANSGAKALELIGKSKKVDVVVTDLVMPNMSGRELTEQILKIAPGTRIIWSSGYMRAGNAGEQERYLQKPFSSQDLLRKVKQILRQ